ncbi:TMP-TENI-domain-containing protein [Plenodomus tracheiphilus IPT5]|uniref:TMP-TENI-domain-containing protein n=1 Tax=Plenodomus tracheiphilus IPT5 TaxID=1408161 RepID=A0A6A7ANM6_9PLEO|nr:TMP-TENI-domain-containing protein [Plenodomus tracheiphilus IPT5]
MMKDKVDYSLYLVTDSTKAILGDRDLADVVEQALLGGVTIVQYRDKTSDTGALISTAKALHAKCKAHNIPLLINDRVDVALAIDCEGVHIGQDDMSVSAARQLLGPDKIIGATVSSIEEARVAVEQGADYLGIGTLYATQTKKNTKDIIGVKGIRKILRYLDNANEASKNIKTVCIGGINASNIPLIIHQLLAPTPSTRTPKTINGVALVSAVIGSPDPKSSSQTLLHLLKSPPPFKAKSSEPFFWLENNSDEISHLLSTALTATKKVKQTTPLSHNMTNLVVQNLAANVALAIGASPIMANYGAEATDLSKLGGSLVINMGTVTPDGLTNYTTALTAYNAAGNPVIFDPVGAGATHIRRSAVSTLMATGYFDLIKGNEREILQVARASGFTVASVQSQQKGVDTGTALFSLDQKAHIVSTLAARERNIILMTGAVDVISDGYRTYTIHNGHAYLGLITGSGCSLGTTLSAYLAANPGDKLYAAIAGILHYEVAAEEAAARQDVKGPGSFVPAFIDELWNVGVGVVEGKRTWEGVARVECVKEIVEDGILVLE